MSIRKVKLVVGEFYHLYNRGNSKQKIFLDFKDYNRFIDLLYAVNTEEKFNFADSVKGIAVYQKLNKNPLVAIGSYVLMPNHFHILVTPISDDGISKFMQKLSTAYVMYFNQKYNRTGSLFEGKFKSQHAADDRYLKYLFSYINLNPVKLFQKDWKEKGIKNPKEALDFLSKYQYSSFLYFSGAKRVQNAILNLNHFPKYFPNKGKFYREILDWIKTL